MDLRQLQALIAIADHGTFSAAAEALATVQSNVSTHVRRLERELGATLVDRQAGRLTQEGEAVVERARRIEAELEALVADVGALKHDVTGRVRAGIIGTTARWLVPPLLDLLGRRHPHVEVEIVDATSTSLEPQLVNGRLDLAVVNLPMPVPDIVTELLFTEDLLLFVPTADLDRLAGPKGKGKATRRRSVTLHDLEGVPLFLPPKGTAFRDLIGTAAEAEGVTLVPKAELDGIRLIASLAIAGRGAAILPATAIPTTLQTDTHPVPVRGLPRREVGVALRRRALPGAPARAFLEVLREVVADPDQRPDHVYQVGSPSSPGLSV
jgi:DNA-binding transcriptional LysR family regulator